MLPISHGIMLYIHLQHHDFLIYHSEDSFKSPYFLRKYLPYLLATRSSLVYRGRHGTGITTHSRVSRVNRSHDTLTLSPAPSPPPSHWLESITPSPRNHIIIIIELRAFANPEKLVRRTNLLCRV